MEKTCLFKKQTIHKSEQMNNIEQWNLSLVWRDGKLRESPCCGGSLAHSVSFQSLQENAMFWASVGQRHELPVFFWVFSPEQVWIVPGKKKTQPWETFLAVTNRENQWRSKGKNLLVSLSCCPCRRQHRPWERKLKLLCVWIQPQKNSSAFPSLLLLSQI